MRESALRWYQQEAYDSAIVELGKHRSTMAVLSTGLGKTRLFTYLAKNWPGRVLVLAHRKELVDQAAESLREHCGERVEIEQGKSKSMHARIVVGSTQSMAQESRLYRIGASGFSLVIVDEVHRYRAKTFQRVVDFFGAAKVFGVTATADRTDKKALGVIMDTVCYRMDIKDGIRSGYLVPLRIGRVNISGIDLRGINKVGGDLHEGKLERLMLQNVGACVTKMMELHPDRQGIVFCPGVESAELGAQVANSIKPGCAMFIDGTTDIDEREQLNNDFRAGKYQYFFNCNIAVEGYDAPTVSLVAILRKTMSRSLYTQMVGRGARVDASCVQGIDGRDRGAERRGAIEWSEKPDCVILDFCGNDGKHDLVSPLDLLGGDYDDEEKAMAKKEMEELGADEVADPEELLQNARKKLEARKRALREVEFIVQATVDYLDPFECLSINPEKVAELKAVELKMGRMDLTDSTKQQLERFGLRPDETKRMSQGQGNQMLRQLFNRERYGLCAYPMLQTLKQWGLKTSKVKKADGVHALMYLRECGFGETRAVDTAKLTAIAKGRVA